MSTTKNSGTYAAAGRGQLDAWQWIRSYNTASLGIILDDLHIERSDLLATDGHLSADQRTQLGYLDAAIDTLTTYLGMNR